MSNTRLLKLSTVVVVGLLVGMLWPGQSSAIPSRLPDRPLTNGLDEGDQTDTKKKKKKKRSGKKGKKRGKKKPKKMIRWGQRHNETDAKYDKRYKRMVKRIKQDKTGDFRGGRFFNEDGEEIRLWTYMGHPFIVRTDISKEFTAQMAMYMENLHREFSTAYKILLQRPSRFKEPVEIITFYDRVTYMRAGGMPNSGGQFNFAQNLTANDRGASWPARHYRMMQFTDGIKKFAKWPKGVLKHESCHMELMMRLGYKMMPGARIGYPIIPPIWWNEGQAAVFEWWDFEKTVEENFDEIPRRGRYAPMIRRMMGGDHWRDFNYYWTINRAKWDGEGRTYLNYCESWSIIGYMMTGGKKGRADFRRIFDLTKRVGTNDPDVNFSDRQVGFSRAWEEVFPPEDQEKMAKNWKNWLKAHVSPEDRVPDEDYHMRSQGFDPTVTDKLKRYETEEEQEENKKWVEEYDKKRKRKHVIER